MSNPRKIKREIFVEVCEFRDLPGDAQVLLRTAEFVRRNAQLKASKYAVGAALKSAHSRAVYAGCNVERTTLSSTTHAERSAVDQMIALEGPVKISAIAIVGDYVKGGKKIITPISPGSVDLGYDRNFPRIKGTEDIKLPCAECLQVIWENCFGDESVPIYSHCQNGEIIKVTIGDAYPFRFTAKF